MTLRWLYMSAPIIGTIVFTQITAIFTTLKNPYNSTLTMYYTVSWHATFDCGSLTHRVHCQLDLRFHFSIFHALLYRTSLTSPHSAWVWLALDQIAITGKMCLLRLADTIGFYDCFLDGLISPCPYCSFNIYSTCVVIELSEKTCGQIWLWTNIYILWIFASNRSCFMRVISNVTRLPSSFTFQ